MPEDSRVPIILGRPFLATARAMIDVFNKKITLRVRDDEVIFDVDQSIKRPPAEDDACYGVDDLDDTINLEAQELLANDKSDTFLLKGLEKSIDQADLEKYESFECRAVDNSDSGEPIRHIDSVNTLYPFAREIAEPNKVESEHLYSVSANAIDEKKHELKNLPHHLEDTYLHGDKSFPKIISSKFSKKEKMLLLQVLEKRFFQFLIAPEDQEKTTFTCPYGTFAYRRMPFGLCNALATFQRCMMEIFYNMVEDFMEVFMDDFSILGNSFDCCLANLDRMLARCEETNLVLNWEKCHFMVKKGIVLGHKISGAGIEVDRAKIDVIVKFPYPTNVKGVRSFLGHAGFYRRFIKDFSMISKPMTQLFMKDAKFDFSDDCKKGFIILKEKLTTAPIIISPDWNVPFELMCDASDFAVGAVLGQQIDGEFKPIYYASKTLNNAQEHYTTTKKNFLQLFSLLIRAENLAADLLSRLKNLDLGAFTKEEIADEVSDEHLMILKIELNDDEPWGHHSASITGRKVYESGFFWPSIFKDAKNYVMRCDACQRSGNISSRTVDYVSKWVEAQELPTNDARVVIKFLRRLFARFGVPEALISDRGTHFCYSQLEKALQKYGVTHKLSMAYHPQTNGQTKVTNKAIKRILERSIGYNMKNWSEKLDDALWAFRTAYKTRTRCTPFRLVYGKPCNLPVEIKHKAYWALKQCNMDLTAATKNYFMELNELLELRDGAYENTRIYKERTKRWHDSRLRGDKNFKVGDKVVLFNSKFKMPPGKLKSRWYIPNVVKIVYPYRTVEIIDKNEISFKFNGQRLNKYNDGHIDTGNKEAVEFGAQNTIDRIHKIGDENSWRRKKGSSSLFVRVESRRVEITSCRFRGEVLKEDVSLCSTLLQMSLFMLIRAVKDHICIVILIMSYRRRAVYAWRSCRSMRCIGLPVNS
ncbi:reverse transcriptase domain-containing protein [Tanacetum coccineum]